MAQLDPDYRWREFDGVIVIRPATAWNDPRNPLNAAVGAIAWTDVTLEMTLNRVMALVYNSVPTVVPDRPSTRTFSVNMPSGSVLDVLVASARAHGAVMWSTPAFLSRSKRIRYSLGYRSLNRGDDIGHGVEWSMTTLPPSMARP